MKRTIALLSVNDTASALHISPKRVRLRYQGIVSMLRNQLLGKAYL